MTAQLPRIFTSIGEDYDERVLPSITTEILKSVVVRTAGELLGSFFPPLFSSEGPAGVWNMLSSSIRLLFSPPQALMGHPEKLIIATLIVCVSVILNSRWMISGWKDVSSLPALSC